LRKCKKVLLGAKGEMPVEKRVEGEREREKKNLSNSSNWKKEKNGISLGFSDWLCNKTSYGYANLMLGKVS